MDNASVVRIVLAVLGLAKLLLEPYGYDISQELLDGIANFLAVLFISIAGWRNNYISKKGKQQEEYLKAKGLK